MREKDIENLIARYPEEFFPGSFFTLNGQQFRIGSCYADLVFEDKYNRTIILEIKRGILSRDAAGQIIEYYGLLKKENPNRVIELILCANIVPPERKMFLEQVGIECKELGIAFLSNIAKKYGYQFLDESKTIVTNNDTEKTDFKTAPKRVNVSPSVAAGWIFQANPLKYDVLNALANLEDGTSIKCWQINQHRNEIRKGQLGFIWMSGKESGIYAVAEILSDPALMKAPPEDDKYWIDETRRDEARWRVKLSVKKVFLNNPIFRDQIKRVPGLEKLSILKFSQGTNFPVSQSECEILLKLADVEVI